MVPLGVEQMLIWGEHEDFVPLPLARRHDDAATKSGDRARLIVIPGIGHFESTSPQSSAWRTVLEAIRSLLGRRCAAGHFPPHREGIPARGTRNAPGRAKA